MVHRERMKELMCFLWDNYLEVHESEHIVLMGVGDSYSAVRELLVNRGKHRLAFDNLFWFHGLGDALKSFINPIPRPHNPPKPPCYFHTATY